MSGGYGIYGGFEVGHYVVVVVFIFSLLLLLLLLFIYFFTNPCVEVGGTFKLNFNLCPGNLELENFQEKLEFFFNIVKC